MTQQDSRTVVERYLKALREGDFTAVPDLIAAHATYRIPGDHPLAGTHVGLEEIVGKFMTPMAALFDPTAPYAVEVSSFVAEGAHVAVECVSSTTTATGRPYSIEISAHFTVEDGRIVSMREYFDTQYFARTLFGQDTDRGTHR
jgi:ketosteroid isomerase-like protein